MLSVKVTVVIMNKKNHHIQEWQLHVWDFTVLGDFMYQDCVCVCWGGGFEMGSVLYGRANNYSL